MNLISWNMHQRPGNWAVLANLMREHHADAAMVQEAVAPPGQLPGDLRVFADPSQPTNPWQLPVPAGCKRNFASAIAVSGDAAIERWTPTALGKAAYGGRTISHPGQWVALALGEGETRIWVVSLYGIWDKTLDTGHIFAEATLHRAISDLAPLLYATDTARVVLAGDLNVWRGYGGKKWEPGYRSVFQRLEAYGLALAGPYAQPGSVLDGCPCADASGCRHVRTYRHQQRKDSTPYQLDFAFSRGVKVAGCSALDEERLWEHSDHCPILIEVVGP